MTGSGSAAGCGAIAGAVAAAGPATIALGLAAGAAGGVAITGCARRFVSCSASLIASLTRLATLPVIATERKTLPRDGASPIEEVATLPRLLIKPID